MVLLIVTLGSCGPKRGTGGTGSTGGDGGAAEADGRVELTRVEIPYYTQGGERKWVVRAESITGETDEGAVDLAGVECEVFEQGAKAAWVRAAAIHIDYDNRNLVLAGEVAMQLVDREIDLECGKLRWNWGDGAFVGSGGVVFSKGKLAGRAEGVRGSTRGEQFVLY